jgi:hypothetical protein
MPIFLAVNVVVMGLLACLFSFGPQLGIDTEDGSFTASGQSYWTVAALVASLLAATALLPKPRDYTSVVAVVAVLGVLLVLVQLFFNRPNGFYVGWASWFVLAFTVLQAIAAVVMLKYRKSGVCPNGHYKLTNRAVCGECGLPLSGAVRFGHPPRAATPPSPIQPPPMQPPPPILPPPTPSPPYNPPLATGSWPPPPPPPYNHPALQGQWPPPAPVSAGEVAGGRLAGWLPRLNTRGRVLVVGLLGAVILVVLNTTGAFQSSEMRACMKYSVDEYESSFGKKPGTGDEASLKRVCQNLIDQKLWR